LEFATDRKLADFRLYYNGYSAHGGLAGQPLDSAGGPWRASRGHPVVSMADTLPWTLSDADRSVSSRSDFVSDGNYAGELKLLEFAIDTISCCLSSRFSASTARTPPR
jgi:hypothetical protein